MGYGQHADRGCVPAGMCDGGQEHGNGIRGGGLIMGIRRGGGGG